MERNPPREEKVLLEKTKRFFNLLAILKAFETERFWAQFQSTLEHLVS